MSHAPIESAAGAALNAFRIVAVAQASLAAQDALHTSSSARAQLCTDASRARAKGAPDSGRAPAAKRGAKLPQELTAHPPPDSGYYEKAYYYRDRAHKIFDWEKNRWLESPKVTSAQKELIAPYQFQLDGAKRRLGCCNYANKLITLNAEMVYGGIEAKVVWETVRHEIAHACTPGAKHGSKWKAMMKKMGAKDVKACCSDKTAKIKREIVKGKYRVFCPKGGPDGAKGHFACWYHRLSPKLRRGCVCPKCKTKLTIHVRGN